LYHFKGKCVCRRCRNKSKSRQYSNTWNTNKGMISSSLLLFRTNWTSCDSMPSLLAVVTTLLCASLCSMTKSFTTIALDKTHISGFILSLCYIGHIVRAVELVLCSMATWVAIRCFSQRSSLKQASKVGTGLRFIKLQLVASKSNRNFIKNWSLLLVLCTIWITKRVAPKIPS